MRPGNSNRPNARGARRGARWLLGMAVSLLLLPPSLHACRYNVRDLGFIDVPAEDYSLLAVFADATDAADLNAEQRRLERAFLDSNVHPTVLRRSELAQHPQGRALDATDLADLPVQALVSPDGFATNLAALVTAPPPAGTNLAGALLNSSPARQELAAACARVFGVILLIEGADPTRNATAQKTVRKAIAEIRDGMADLPKAIVAPPELVTLKAADIPGETALFWSLGLPARVAEAPRAAVFYGKSRWIGPLMEGRHITVENLSRLFWIIGADCECGMDLAWTRGTALPLRWTDTLHASAAQSLGFDPASPLVRAEALRIINRYSRGERGETYLARNSAPGSPASETRPYPPANPTVDVAPPAPENPPLSDHASNVVARIPAPPPAATTKASPENEAARSEAQARADRYRILLIMAFIGLLLFLCAGLILLLAARRWRRLLPADSRRDNSKSEDGEPD